MKEEILMTNKCLHIANIVSGGGYCHHEQSNRVYDSKGICPTVCTRYDEFMTGFKIMNEEKVKLVGGVGIMKSNNGKQFYQQDRIYDSENIALCQSANESFNPYYTQNLRIRKLTPKECFRLMGFDDKDFMKAEKVNSNAQLYKQAGNSIVVNVLEAIFKEML